jgi:hypothetical protein
MLTHTIRAFSLVGLILIAHTIKPFSLGNVAAFTPPDIPFILFRTVGGSDAASGKCR